MLNPERLLKDNINPASIKNIVFDLGNVLIDIDMKRTVEKFKSLGLERLDALYSIKKQSQMFKEFELGNISIEQFRSNLRPHLNPGTTDDSIDDAWNAMLTYLPEERVGMLEKIKPYYHLFLLSNTNELHVTSFITKAEKQYGKGIFEKLFERTYYSNEIHYHKPDEQIFNYVTKDANINPAETLFIDDVQANILGAIKIGWYGYCLNEGNILAMFNI